MKGLTRFINDKSLVLFPFIISTPSHPSSIWVSLFPSFVPVSVLCSILGPFYSKRRKELDGQRLIRYSVTIGAQPAVALTTCRYFVHNTADTRQGCDSPMLRTKVVYCTLKNCLWRRDSEMQDFDDLHSVTTFFCFSYLTS